MSWCLLLAALLCWLVRAYEHKICLMTTFRLMTSTSLCGLLEWIDYHVLLGVDHFVLRNDCSFDAAAVGEALSRYAAAGQLSLDTTPQEKCDRTDQRKIYTAMSAKFSVLRKCEWLSIVDNDEYISFADSVDLSSSAPLRSYVDLLEVPFSRMMWFVVGNENLETRPNGTIIGAFLHGSMEKPHYLKTLVKTEITLQFTNPHFPKLFSQYDRRYVVPKPSSNGVYKVVYDAGSADNTSLLSWRKFVEINAYHRCERLVNASSRTPREARPPYGLFLKHFKYLSWQEYREQRAATPLLANGRKNYWGEDSRRIWELGRPVDRHFLWGDKFTARMAAALMVGLRGRCTNPNSNPSPEKTGTQDVCCNFWTNASLSTHVKM